MYRIGQEEIDAVARAIYSRQFFKINDAGQECRNFEKEWSETVGKDYTLLMSSGFGALVSGLIGLGIGPGDEVIVPAYTYIATALAVTTVGAIPVIVDIDETMTISVRETEKKITEHTKAIIPVHIQGFPCDMDGLKSLSEKYHIAILEDACQADGGMYKGRYLGTIGEVGAYSFNYFKVLTAGEGGALVTDDRRIFERALIYHDSSAVAFFGDQLSDVTEPLFGGTEFRVSDITGAILREQLKKMPELMSDLRRVKREIAEKLTNVETAPSHDADGDCGTTLALRFDTEAKCRAFAEKCAASGIGLTVPLDTGKHVYTNWTQIMNRRGALHPAMDPFLMKENEGLQMNYTPDMCSASLDLLARTAYLSIDPDWTADDIQRIADILNS